VCAVDKVQGAMAKRGLSVLAPGRLLLVAVANGIAYSCGVAVSLRRNMPHVSACACRSAQDKISAISVTDV